MMVLGVFQRLFGALMEVPGVVVTISFWLGESFSNSLQKRLAMITACSRVAVPDGERCALPEPSEMPFTMV